MREFIPLEQREFLLEAFRRLIEHEPNTLGEMEDANGFPLKDDGVVAVVYIYGDGTVSWYADEDR